MVSLLRRKQTSLSLGTIEADHIEAIVEIHEVVWLQKLLVGLFDLELEPTLI
jgi:hypothetical protein